MCFFHAHRQFFANGEESDNFIYCECKYGDAGGACCSPANGIPLDDVALAIALIAKVQAIQPVDTKRVYSTGMSNGGFMSIRLGCVASHVFAAVGSVAGALGNTLPAQDTFPCRR